MVLEVANLKVVYYPNNQSINTGSSRQRVFLIQSWLLEHGVEAWISSAPFQADIMVIQKTCSSEILEIMREAKRLGIITIFDEDDLYWCECAKEADYITVDTEEKITWLQSQTNKKLKYKVVKDLLDYLKKPLPIRIHEEKETLEILMFANPENLGNFNECEEALLELKKRGKKFNFTYLSGSPENRPSYHFPEELNAKWIPWSLETYSENLQKFDLALAPQRIAQKGPGKMIEAIGHNLAVVGSAIPSVKEWAKETRNEEFICNTTEEWVSALEKMWDPKIRNAQLERTLSWIWKNRSIDIIGQAWLDFFTTIMKEKKENESSIV